MNTEVKYFDSAMSGAPALSGTAGTLIAVLDACLVNGFGAVTVNSLAVASGVATVTVSTGHGFAMLGNTGPVIQVSGATPAGLNVEWRIASFTNSTTFTFACPGVADGPASGTITAKRASAGWEKRYSGTNKAAYARLDPDATAMLLRVDDSNAQWGLVRGYEAMTDIDTGTGMFPTEAQVATANGKWTKSSAASTASRPWSLIASGKRIIFLPRWSTTFLYRDVYVFGDLTTYKAGDLFHCLLSLTNSAAIGYPGNYNTVVCPWGATHGPYFPRAYNGLGSAVMAKCVGAVTITNPAVQFPIGYSGGTLLLPYPNAADDALYLRGELEYFDGVALRGRLGGCYAPAQQAPLADLDVITGVAGLEGRTLIALAIGGNNGASNYEGRIFMDLDAQ